MAQEKIAPERVERVFAHLMRFGGVSPSQISNAVSSARRMEIGDDVTLGEDDDQKLLRGAFIFNEVKRLKED